MGRLSTQKIPEDLEQFFKSLKASNCSAKWDWNKLIEVIRPANRNGKAFLGLCEAGVFHMMYSKTSKRESNLLCKKLHTSDIDLLNSVGICYALQLLSGIASNRIDKFKETFEQIVSSLLDAIITALKISDFNAPVLQPLTALQDTKKSVLPRISPMNETGVTNILELALCRMYVLSSTLRSLLEHGTSVTVPVSLPYLCSVIAAAFSVNICDARRSSFVLISCAKHLLHTFSVIVQSCGVNISPAAPSLFTSMVYQLEWSSNFARCHPSEQSLTYKLAVYRCISSLLDATVHVASPTLCRLANRVIYEVSSDISFPARENLNQMFISSGGDLAIYELQICCTVASLHLLEVLFVNHHFILNCSIAEGADFCDYKLKHALLSLSSEVNALASRLVFLLSKQNRLNSIEEVLIRPHFLMALIDTASAVVDYGFLFSRFNALYDLTKSLLAHKDYDLRLTADRCFRHSFKFLKSETPCLANEKLFVSSFTQTDETNPSIQPEKEETNATSAVEYTSKAGTLVEKESTSHVSANFYSNVSEHHKPMNSIKSNSIPVEKTMKPFSSEMMETPKQSENYGKKRVRFEDTPPNASKKSCIENRSILRAPTPAKPPKQTPAPEENSDLNFASIEEALCTFDDTLL
ncbi:unnamed protein product [Rodentolepis nana]|uniref:DUF5742 domain-containing protein n=1 Tax=Rodentolepis nana TaxID=102285 RepID=A0A0R3TRB1_RODNA|nr:unnamed protein product [Rodentolepis nana]